MCIVSLHAKACVGMQLISMQKIGMQLLSNHVYRPKYLNELLSKGMRIASVHRHAHPSALYCTYPMVHYDLYQQRFPVEVLQLSYV